MRDSVGIGIMLNLSRGRTVVWELGFGWIDQNGIETSHGFTAVECRYGLVCINICMAVARLLETLRELGWSRLPNSCVDMTNR